MTPLTAVNTYGRIAAGPCRWPSAIVPGYAGPSRNPVVLISTNSERQRVGERH
jgi:hypothetical protein